MGNIEVNQVEIDSLVEELIQEYGEEYTDFIKAEKDEKEN